MSLILEKKRNCACTIPGTIVHDNHVTAAVCREFNKMYLIFKLKFEEVVVPISLRIIF